MNDNKTSPMLTRRAARQARVLDAAARLLGTPTADFSMRDLAEAAGVSFATPFNYFGSKVGIMHALSTRLIDTMERRFAAAPQAADAATRVLMAFEIAVVVLLEDPAVTRPVIGSLGTPTSEPGRVIERSSALWAMALGDCAGIRGEVAAIARSSLPGHLALGFRGCISFWVAGEIPDADLRTRARGVAASLMLGFVEREARAGLIAVTGADRAPG